MSCPPLFKKLGQTEYKMVEPATIKLEYSYHYLKRIEERKCEQSIIVKTYSALCQTKVGVVVETFDGLVSMLSVRVKPTLIVVITTWRGIRKRPVSEARLQHISDIVMQKYDKEDKKRQKALKEKVSSIKKPTYGNIDALLIPCLSTDELNLNTAGKRICEELRMFKTSVKSFTELRKSKHPMIKFEGVIFGPILRVKPGHVLNPTDEVIAIVPDPKEMKDKELYLLNRWFNYQA